MSKDMSDSDGSCSWVMVESEKSIQLSENEDQLKLSSLKELHHDDESERVEEMIDNNRNEVLDTSGDEDVSDVDVLDDPDEEVTSTSFPIDELNQKNAEELGSSVRMRYKSKESQTDCKVVENRPVKYGVRDYIKWIDWPITILLFCILLGWCGLFMHLHSVKKTDDYLPQEEATFVVTTPTDDDVQKVEKNIDVPPKIAEKLETEQQTDADSILLKNKLNQIQTENEEMKQTIGKLRYAEISTLKKLIEEHSSVINDLRHENADLRKIVAQLRYSPGQTAHDEESQAEKDMLNQIEKNVVDLKNEFEHFRSIICSDENCQNLKQNQFDTIYENLNQIMKKLNDVSTSDFKAHLDEYLSEIKKFVDSKADKKESEKPTEDKLEKAMENEHEKPKENENEESNPFFGRLSNLLDNAKNAAHEKLSSTFSEDHKENINHFFAKTAKVLENAKNNLKSRLERGKLELNEKSYQKMADFVKNSYGNVADTVQDIYRSKSDDLKATYDKVNGVFKKFKKKWNRKVKKVVNALYEEDGYDSDENEGVDNSWIFERSKDRQRNREEDQTDSAWIIERGNLRRNERKLHEKRAKNVDGVLGDDGAESRLHARRQQFRQERRRTYGDHGHHR